MSDKIKRRHLEKLDRFRIIAVKTDRDSQTEPAVRPIMDSHNRFEDGDGLRVLLLADVSWPSRSSIIPSFNPWRIKIWLSSIWIGHFCQKAVRCNVISGTA
jgi:hypothetical protein